MSETKIIPTTGRNNCGGRCIIYAHVCDGVIEKLSTETKGTPEHPVPLCACAKGLNYHKTFLGEDRLRWPMKRVGERGEGKFARISWRKPWISLHLNTSASGILTVPVPAMSMTAAASALLCVATV